ncbi:MAG: Rieske 2Fe-2S domain-containing protein [Pyrinomonadaceae bacterium]
MAKEMAIELINKQDWLDKASEEIQPVVTNAFKAGGEAGQKVKNFLHGTWLGHPLHPVLTDVPVGAWTAALALDAMEAISGRKECGAGADAAIAVGLVGAVGAAVTGITDWSDVHGKSRKVGLMHGLLNMGGAALYTTSLVMRKRDSRRAGVGFAMLGYMMTGAAAYLGGHLVYADQIGVDHTADKKYTQEFVAVLADADLPENKLTRVEAKGLPVLLVRQHGEIRAIAETCSHLGGPLAEGQLEGDSVRCPWHGSRFALKDGSVIDGPATHPQPCFETRIVNGQIEVRATKQ